MNNYKKILIIGCPGAGKTYFTNLLKKVVNIQVYHLDDLYWKENWQETSKEEWIKIQKNILAKKEFIIDGNYLSSLEMRLKSAELVIYLDKSLISCLLGFFKRTIKNFFKIEINLPKRITNKLTENGMLDFCKYIINFHLHEKYKLNNLLEKYKNNIEIVIIKNRKDIKTFFERY